MRETRIPANTLIDGSNLIDSSVTVNKIENQLIRSVTSATDIPTSSDNGKIILIDTTSGSVTITINSSLNLLAGQRIDFAWIGTATSVAFAQSGTTVNATPGLNMRFRYSAATLLCIASNTYLLVGDLA